MKKSADLYTIKIRCKRYVQRYLMLKFGCPCKGHQHLVDCRKDNELKEFLHRAIKDPVVSRDKWLQNFEGKKRDCVVELKISADLFHRYGYELSITDEVHLNSILEARAKKELLDFLKIQYILHEDIKDAIEEFYSHFGYSENSWPSSSISKIWTRQKAKLDIYCLKKEVNKIFTKIFMDNLSVVMDNLQNQISTCIN